MNYFCPSHIEFSTVMSYNFLLTQNVHFGRFVSENKSSEISVSYHAQRLENTASRIQRYQSHSLRRNGNPSAFLQQARTSSVDSAIRSNSSAQRRLSPLRSDHRSPLRHHGGPQAYQQDRDPAIQWSFPLPAGTLPVSRSVDIAKIPQEASPQGRPSTRCPARPASHQAVYYTQIQNHTDLRSGLCGSHDLWEGPVCQSRLQPQETGQTLLSSPPVLRGPSPGVLAWQLETGRCCIQYRRSAISQTLSGQGSPKYRQQPNPHSGRFGVLWQTCRRVPRYSPMWLYYCGQGVCTHQIPGQRMSFQKDRPRLGSRGISIPAVSLENPSPFHRGQTPYSRRPSRGSATDPLQRPEICLPCPGDQHEDSSLESLAVLRQKGNHREEYPRAPLRLSPRQDPHGGLDCQCGLLSDSSFGLQYRSLVQKTLSSQRISLHYPGYHPNRFSGLAGQVDEEGKPEHPGSSPGLSLPEAVLDCTEKDRQTPVAIICVNLQVTHKLTSSIFMGFRVKNNIF